MEKLLALLLALALVLCGCGQAGTTTYDDQGRVLREYIDGAWREYSYDDAGNMIKMAVSSSVINYYITYEYDVDGMAVLHRYYDTNGSFTRAQGFNDLGQRIRSYHVVDGQMVLYESFEYDDKGREILCLNYDDNGAVYKTYAYTYDSDGRLIKKEERYPESIYNETSVYEYAPATDVAYVIRYYNVLGYLISESYEYTNGDWKYILYSYEDIEAPRVYSICVYKHDEIGETVYTYYFDGRYSIEYSGGKTEYYSADGSVYAEESYDGEVLGADGNLIEQDEEWWDFWGDARVAPPRE